MTHKKLFALYLCACVWCVVYMQVVSMCTINIYVHVRVWGPLSNYTFFFAGRHSRIEKTKKFPALSRTISQLIRPILMVTCCKHAFMCLSSKVIISQPHINLYLCKYSFSRGNGSENQFVEKWLKCTSELNYDYN